MILFNLAMKPVIWGVSTGLRVGLGAGRAVLRGAGQGGAAAHLYKAAASSVGAAADTGNIYVNAAGSAAKRLLLRKDPTSAIGYRMPKHLDDAVLLGLFGVGAYTGATRGAAIGMAAPGANRAMTGAPMTPQRLREAARLNMMDNLSADGSLTLALHHLR